MTTLNKMSLSQLREHMHDTAHVLHKKTEEAKCEVLRKALSKIKKGDRCEFSYGYYGKFRPVVVRIPKTIAGPIHVRCKYQSTFTKTAYLDRLSRIYRGSRLVFDRVQECRNYGLIKEK